MRTSKLTIATILAVAAFGVSAQTRMESPTSPFTYEALNATPSLKFGRNGPSTPAGVQQRPAAKTSAAPGQSGGMFTYDAVGATPHVKRPAALAGAPLQPASR
jgi:hypothetical protein